MSVRFDADAEDFTRTTTLPSNTARSVTCWAKVDTDRNTFSTLWDLHSAGADNYEYIQTNADGTTFVAWNDDGSAISLTGPNVTVGTWYYFAYCRSAGNIEFYWRAITATTLSSATSTLGGSPSASTGLIIGESHFTGEWLNGSIAALKIWSGVSLSAAEALQDSFQQVPCVQMASVNSFYPFLIGGAVAGAQADYGRQGLNLSNGTNSATGDGLPITWRRKSQYCVMPTAAGGGGGDAVPQVWRQYRGRRAA